MSRQVFAYCVAYHTTGDEKYLQYAKAGIDYIYTKMVDKDGVFYTWRENGVRGPENAKQRISQDLAYALMGPAMYYYSTRDRAVLDVMLSRPITGFVFTNERVKIRGDWSEPRPMGFCVISLVPSRVSRVRDWEHVHAGVRTGKRLVQGASADQAEPGCLSVAAAHSLA